MKNSIQKIKDLIQRVKFKISTSSRERIALIICIPITLISVILCGILLAKSIKNDKEKSSDEGEQIYFFDDGFFIESSSGTRATNILEYQSIGNGSCMVMGIGTYSSGELIIPSKSPSGERVVGIGNRAFEGCTSLVSVSIPACVTNIGSGVFKGCSSLVMITVEPENEKYSCAGGILYSKDKTRLICCPASRIGNNYLLDPNVRIIDDYAFEGIKNISRILYEKSTSDFEKISIGVGNDDFRALPITCNYAPTK